MILLLNLNYNLPDILHVTLRLSVYFFNVLFFCLQNISIDRGKVKNPFYWLERLVTNYCPVRVNLFNSADFDRFFQQKLLQKVCLIRCWLLKKKNFLHGYIYKIFWPYIVINKYSLGTKTEPSAVMY